jgi:transcription elongation GreA/GreB family factor
MALIGARVGDVIDVEAPSGIMQYQILEIDRTV